MKKSKLSYTSYMIAAYVCYTLTVIQLLFCVVCPPYFFFLIWMLTGSLGNALYDKAKKNKPIGDTMHEATSFNYLSIPVHRDYARD